MIRVGFFLDAENMGAKDCREIFEGNPGVGGSEYEVILISALLTLRHAEQFEITVFTNGKLLLPDILQKNAVYFNGADELEILCGKQGIDILVLDARRSSAYYQAFDTARVMLIPWAECFMSTRQLYRYARAGNIPRIVCVGREELDLYRDHPAFNKSTYIYNAVPILDSVKKLAVSHPFAQRKNEVAYMGSLIPDKGFHCLALVWKDIVKEFPDAVLHVIGSGKLYSQDARLGRYGIADSAYEDSFMPYLTDENGEILSSVHLHGVLGKEKYEVLSRCKVAVPNPSGDTETFGIVAVEMQIAGCLVATKRCPGFMDTVCDSGILYDDVNELSSAVIDLLRRKDNSYEAMLSEIERKFSYDEVIAQWVELFDSVFRGKPFIPDPQVINSRFQKKWVREINRRVRKVLPITPPLCLMEELLRRCRNRMKGVA
ncbi:MAG: glycosyltransferase family 4 protein [Pontiella sp.]